MLLSGCGHLPGIWNEPPALKVCPIIPGALLDCPPAPEPPQGEMTQADVARYVIDLWASGEACRERLARVREIYSPEK